MRCDVFGKHYKPGEKPEDFGDLPALNFGLQFSPTLMRLNLLCQFASEEELRQMNRQEFRQLLRERLQAFGDEILATWEKQYGDGGTNEQEADHH